MKERHFQTKNKYFFALFFSADFSPPFCHLGDSSCPQGLLRNKCRGFEPETAASSIWCATSEPQYVAIQLHFCSPVGVLAVGDVEVGPFCPGPGSSPRSPPTGPPGQPRSTLPAWGSRGTRRGCRALAAAHTLMRSLRPRPGSPRSRRPAANPSPRLRAGRAVGTVRTLKSSRPLRRPEPWERRQAQGGRQGEGSCRGHKAVAEENAVAGMSDRTHKAFVL